MNLACPLPSQFLANSNPDSGIALETMILKRGASKVELSLVAEDVD